MVTGASSGIGFELAKLFAEDGHDLIVAAEDNAIQESADKLGDRGVGVLAVQVDLRKPDDVELLYRTASGNGRPLDVAVLNAGLGHGGPFVDGDLESDLAVVDLNVHSTVVLAKLLLRDMTDRGTGKMLLTSSVAATMPGSLQAVYNASKSFIQSFAEALYDELRETGITVTSLMPDTIVGRMPKDDAAKVARRGYEALMSGRRKVVAESVMSKAMGVAGSVLPDSVMAVASRLISIPVGRI